VETNMGRIDAGLRWTLAAVLFGVSLILSDRPAIGLLAAVAAVVMVGTAVTRSCPLYHLLGIRTCPKSPNSGVTQRRVI
jgi:hypothetical protein